MSEWATLRSKLPESWEIDDKGYLSWDTGDTEDGREQWSNLMWAQEILREHGYWLESEMDHDTIWGQLKKLGSE